MNIIKTLRRPYLSLFMAFVILFVSCEQYETTSSIEKQSFDRKVFETYKSQPYLTKVLKSFNKYSKKNSSTLETNKELLNIINEELETSIQVPEEILALSVNVEAETIYSQSLENNWLTEQDVQLSKKLAELIEKNDIETALMKYENLILNSNLSNEKFEQQNLIVNTVRSLNYENPEMFAYPEYQGKFSWWRCSLAALALTVAIGNMSTCATIVACGVATLLLVNAGYAVADHCDPE